MSFKKSSLVLVVVAVLHSFIADAIADVESKPRIPDASWFGGIDNYDCVYVRRNGDRELHCWGGNVPVTWMERLTCPISKYVLPTMGRERMPCGYWHNNFEEIQKLGGDIE